MVDFGNRNFFFSLGLYQIKCKNGPFRNISPHDDVVNNASPHHTQLANQLSNQTCAVNWLHNNTCGMKGLQETGHLNASLRHNASLIFKLVKDEGQKRASIAAEKKKSKSE